MARRVLKEHQKKRILEFLAQEKGAGRPGRNDIEFIEAVLWVLRCGTPWRDIPVEFGSWHAIYKRFDTWSRNGKWKRLFAFMRASPDCEWASIDSTVNRAHQHAAGGKGGPKLMGLGEAAGASRLKFISWWMLSRIPSTSKSPKARSTMSHKPQD